MDSIDCSLNVAKWECQLQNNSFWLMIYAFSIQNGVYKMGDAYLIIF